MEKWLETICLKCKKTFVLDYRTVTLGCEDITYEAIPVITCPHCGKRYEY